MRTSLALAAAAALAALPACQMQFGERITGTAIGTGAGVVVGGLLGSAVGSTAGGAVLGGIAGGAAGYIIGDWIQDRRERQAAAAQPYPEPQGAAPYEAPPDAEVTYTSGSTPRPRSPAPAATSATSAAEARREYEAGRISLTAEEALAHYATAIHLDPSRPEPMNAQGLVLLYMGHRAQARASFERALAADPAYEPAAYNLRRLGNS